MFTGIVEETGFVEAIEPSTKSIRLAIRMEMCGRDLEIGHSLAVNGCCLTVVDLRRKRGKRIATFDLLQETWRRTNLQFVASGAAVNLERPLRADARLGGHFVTGHIDGLGRIRNWKPKGTDWLLEIDAPADLMRYIVFKGSIAVDGISLTVAGVQPKSFQIWIIPHTYEVTALRERKAGDALNLETDILGKYVERFLPRKISRP